MATSNTSGGTRRRAAAQKPAPEPEDDDVQDADVVGIHDGPVDLDLDVEDSSRAHIPPMTVRLGGEVFSIQPPDGKTVMDIEEAENTRAVLALIFDDQWPRARPLIDDIDDPAKLNKLARQFSRHMEIDEQAMRALADNPGSGRAARRRARRRASGRRS